MQDDMLSSLPTDALYHLCRVLAKDSMRADGVNPFAHAEQTRRTLHASSVIHAYQSLRTCCRYLRDVSDHIRTSIAFHVRDQHLVKSYLQKLPSLNAVSITYSHDARNIRSSLIALHTILPRLTSLTLAYASPRTSSARQDRNPEAEAGRVTADISVAMPAWSATLQCLRLRYINCVSSSAQTGRNGLAFLSHLTSLKSLQLKCVSPPLQRADLSGCTGLTKLSVHGSLHRVNMDLSLVKSLQELECTSYGIEHLNISGLTALRTLSCGENRLVELDTSRCESLETLTCVANGIRKLDVMHNPSLRFLDCSHNPISILLLQRSPLLTHLYCHGTDVTQLDLSNNSCMLEIGCTDAKLTALDVTPAAATLTSLCCSLCPLLSLRANGCSNLQTLYCRMCYGLQELSCRGCDSLITLETGQSGAFGGLSIEALLQLQH